MWTLASSPSSRSARIFGSPVRNTSSGILRLVAKLVPGSVCCRRPRASLNSSSLLGVGQHDEAALGAGDLDRRIEHQRQHVVEHAAAAERAQAVEQRRDLAQVADRGGRRLVLRRAGVGEQEDELGAAGAPEADAIAVRQRPVAGDRLVVDEGAVAGLLVADDEAAAGRDDLGVVARDFAAREAQVVGLAPADAERFLGDRHDPPAERVGDFQACVWHGRGKSIKYQPATRIRSATARTTIEPMTIREGGAEA